MLDAGSTLSLQRFEVSDTYAKQYLQDLLSTIILLTPLDESYGKIVMAKLKLCLAVTLILLQLLPVQKGVQRGIGNNSCRVGKINIGCKAARSS